MSKSDPAWLQRQQRDPYVKQSRADKYRSRSAYKLIEIDQKARLFHPGQTVVDLGAAPGGWAQYAARRVGSSGLVIAVDILPMAPVSGVRFIHGDFAEETTLQACLDALGEHRADLVISDMAPNLSGIRHADQARSLHLAELALDFARRTLRPGGDLLVKVFEGSGLDAFRQELGSVFQKVSNRKPQASRDASREFYILARSCTL